MPLSKKRDKQRKRLEEAGGIRLEKLTSSPQTSKPVQLVGKGNVIAPWGGIDDDGNPIPEL